MSLRSTAHGRATPKEVQNAVAKQHKYTYKRERETQAMQGLPGRAGSGDPPGQIPDLQHRGRGGFLRVCGAGGWPVKIRGAGVRRFRRRMKRLRLEAERGEIGWADVGNSVKAWVAHAAHAQSWRMRCKLLSG